MRSKEKTKYILVSAEKSHFRPWRHNSEQNIAIPQGAYIPMGGDRKSTKRQVMCRAAISAMKRIREK